MNVADAMTPAPLTVAPRPSVAAALRLARDTATSRRLVGVVRREMAPTPEAVA